MERRCTECEGVVNDFNNECESCGVIRLLPEVEIGGAVEDFPSDEDLDLNGKRKVDLVNYEQLPREVDPWEAPQQMKANRIGNIHLVTGQELLFNTFPIATIEDVIQFLVFCKSKHLPLQEVEVDTETEGLFNHRNKIKILQVGNRFLDIQFVIDADTVDIKRLKPYLEDPSLIKIFHNASFDLKFLRLYEIFVREVWDTFLAECILTNGYETLKETDEYGEQSDYYEGYIKRELGLGAIVWREFEHALNKDIRGNINRLGLVDSVVQYSGEDVVFLGRLKELQYARLVESNEIHTMKLENLFVVALSKIEFHGFKLDPKKWMLQDQKHQVKKEEARKKLDEFVLNDAELSKHFVNNQLDLFTTTREVKVKWSSAKQVLKVLKFLGVNTKTVDKKTKKLKDSVEEKQLTKQKDKFPIIPLFIDYQGWSKLVSTYGEGFLKHINPTTGRIHCDFWQIINTGRISSREPNLQNIPSQGEEGKALRSCFIAEDGYLFSICDYSQQESRVLADRSQDKDMINFFLDGTGDIHSMVATKMFSIIERKEIIVTNDKSNPHYAKRNIGKTLGFKIAYGGSAYTIKDELKVSQAEAQHFVDAYFAAFPRIKQYFDKKIAETLRQGYVLIDDITGRRWRLPKWEKWKTLQEKVNNYMSDLGRDFFSILSAESKVYKGLKAKHGEDSFLMYYKGREYADLYISNREAFILKGEMERVAQNAPIQGSSGSMTKLAAVRIDRELVQGGYSDIPDKKGWDDIRMVNLVHDEIVLEAKKDLIEITNEVTQRHMVEAGGMFCKSVPMVVIPENASFWQK